MADKVPRSLPERPHLDHLKKQAKARHRALRERDAGARLSDAQLAIAREYGFKSWRALKTHIDELQDAAKRLLRLVGQGELSEASALVDQRPELVHATAPHPFWGGCPQALHLSIEKGQRPLFDLILDRGADVNGENRAYDGWSPLMLAVRWQRSAMCDELLRRGARCGLIESLMMEDDERVETLLRDQPDVLKGAMPNAGTPLHFVRTVRAARLLVEAGVPLNATDKYEKTPLDAVMSRGEGNESLVQYLTEQGGGVGHAAGLAAMGDLPALEKLVRESPDTLNQAYPLGGGKTTALHAAIERGQLELVRWILDQGVSVQQTVGQRVTPLHTAAWWGQVEIVEMLIERGADAAARDEHYDNTPLGWAKTNLEIVNRPGCAEVVAHLEQAGKLEDENSTRR